MRDNTKALGAFLFCTLLGCASAIAEDGDKVKFRNIDLEKIFDETHGKDPRLGFRIKAYEKKEFQGEDSTYGEMTTTGLKTFLTYVINKFSLNPATIRFLDVGSGVGRLPMGACALADFEKCDGVELSLTRFNLSQKALNNFLKNFDQILKPKQVTFWRMNAVDYDMSSYNLVWIASLCMSEVFVEKLRLKIEKESPDGAVIVSIQAFTLPKKSRLKKIAHINIPQSWNKKSKSYVYRIKGAPLSEGLEEAKEDAA